MSQTAKVRSASWAVQGLQFLLQTAPSIEVVAADDARTNKYPHALWHVLAADKPVATTSFGYGAAIQGMKPEIASAEPEPLEAGTDYLLLIEAGKNHKGKLSFQSPF